ncbi:arylesterase [Hoeflea prorocentri]|uniref:Arylesterase n=1 Tax=Hoeflea prorocentri TaxID=1922333 RepID=A0A9X3UMW9_9HYPH|nr:arylesterase [Hoeflea prorocentri]MCY6383330.1 arylesterase [Hoeflea prorocentri]MDA5401130.1 arylesterase [Hoeflea prorocentri]
MKIKAAVQIFAIFCSMILLASATVRAETVSIVGLGDSLMAGYELPPADAFPSKLEQALVDKGYDISVTNAGVSGDTSSGGLARLDWSVPDGTDAVLVELGANDALRGIGPDQTRANIEAMITRLKERGIAVLLVGMLSPPNMGADYAEAFNRIYPELSRQHGVPLYPFFLDGVAAETGLDIGDGMHPNAKGVDVMVARFLPYAEELIAAVREKNGS